MRVDIIVGGCSIEESLALLPILACVLKRRAGSVDVGLCQSSRQALGVEVLAGVVERGGSGLQVAVMRRKVIPPFCNSIVIFFA